ncbi:MAG TPA: alpha/beta fold hydrolase [Solirubrobacteraceae bacterium]
MPTIELHGHRVSYRSAGEGPVLLLIHGITSSSRTWEPVVESLAADHTVIAPDLLGHGESAKPRGDYSLGAYASGVRDLLIALGHERATVVGHSLGGGIAMQFAYQFPELVERLVLVSSGGLGREVSALLRAATLPGSEYVLPLLCGDRAITAATGVARALGTIGLRPSDDVREGAAGFASLGDAHARRAFLATLRTIVDAGGQRVSARDRLYLAEAVPTLIVWGERDPIIPVAHGRSAHEAMPGSHLRVFYEAGHFPHVTDPQGFVHALREFIAETEPARADPARLREALLTGPPA